MKIVIVFHSVCGNNYVLAKEFQLNFAALGHEVMLRRVADPDLPQLQTRFAAAGNMASHINSIPTALPEELPHADMVVLGSPNYFGCMSAEMKAFLDSTGIFYLKQPLKGRKLITFCSSSTAAGGGTFCLESMIHYGQHMGMLHVTVPVNLQMLSSEISAYGVCHVSGANGDQRPKPELLAAIKHIAEYSANLP